jgi:hypothetical protein
MKESQKLNNDAKAEQRKAILAALAKAQGNKEPPDISHDEPDGDNDGYYILTREELTALLSGNIEKIQNWVDTLDQRQATTLLRWLIKENA